MANEPEILGNYEIIGKIGQGGFANVYRARDQYSNREVAIKVIKGSHTDKPELVKRFMREAQLAARLNHPSLTAIYDAGIFEDNFYIVMQSVEGRTLRNILDERQRLSLGETIHILTQVAQALDYIHEHGIIHRDLKPDNILVQPDGRVMIIDFGLALPPRAEILTTHITPFNIVGTPAYISPEQAAVNQKMALTSLVDIYALGVMTYEMLTGQLPFVGETLVAVIHAHVYEKPPNPAELVPELGRDVAQVLLKALAKNPAKRFSSAGAFVAALSAAATKQKSSDFSPNQLATTRFQVKSSSSQEDTNKSRLPIIGAIVITVVTLIFGILSNLIANFLSNQVNLDFGVAGVLLTILVGLTAMTVGIGFYFGKRDEERKKLIERIRNQQKIVLTSNNISTITTEGQQL